MKGGMVHRKVRKIKKGRTLVHRKFGKIKKEEMALFEPLVLAHPTPELSLRTWSGLSSITASARLRDWLVRARSRYRCFLIFPILL